MLVKIGGRFNFVFRFFVGKVGKMWFLFRDFFLGRCVKGVCLKWMFKMVFVFDSEF